MKIKQVLAIYVIAFISMMILALFCIPEHMKFFYSLNILILLGMIISLEWVNYGIGQRFVIDFILYLGFSIAIIIGICVNPDLDYIVVKSSVGCIFAITLITTYRTLKTK